MAAKDRRYYKEDWQRDRLERIFQSNKRPTRRQYNDICRDVGIEDRRIVTKWFKDRRRREKKELAQAGTTTGDHSDGDASDTELEAAEGLRSLSGLDRQAFQAMKGWSQFSPNLTFTCSEKSARLLGGMEQAYVECTCAECLQRQDIQERARTLKEFVHHALPQMPEHTDDSAYFKYIFVNLPATGMQVVPGPGIAVGGMPVTRVPVAQMVLDDYIRHVVMSYPVEIHTRVWLFVPQSLNSGGSQWKCFTVTANFSTPSYKHRVRQVGKGNSDTSKVVCLPLAIRHFGPDVPVPGINPVLFPDTRTMMHAAPPPLPQHTYSGTLSNLSDWTATPVRTEDGSSGGVCTMVTDPNSVASQYTVTTATGVLPHAQPGVPQMLAPGGVDLTGGNLAALHQAFPNMADYVKTLTAAQHAGHNPAALPPTQPLRLDPSAVPNPAQPGAYTSAPMLVVSGMLALPGQQVPQQMVPASSTPLTAHRGIMPAPTIPMGMQYPFPPIPQLPELPAAAKALLKPHRNIPPVDSGVKSAYQAADSMQLKPEPPSSQGLAIMPPGQDALTHQQTANYLAVPTDAVQQPPTSAAYTQAAAVAAAAAAAAAAAQQTTTNAVTCTVCGRPVLIAAWHAGHQLCPTHFQAVLQLPQISQYGGGYVVGVEAGAAGAVQLAHGTYLEQPALGTVPPDPHQQQLHQQQQLHAAPQPPSQPQPNAAPPADAAIAAAGKPAPSATTMSLDPEATQSFSTRLARPGPEVHDTAASGAEQATNAGTSQTQAAVPMAVDQAGVTLQHASALAAAAANTPQQLMLTPAGAAGADGSAAGMLAAPTAAPAGVDIIRGAGVTDAQGGSLVQTTSGVSTGSEEVQGAMEGSKRKKRRLESDVSSRETLSPGNASAIPGGVPVAGTKLLAAEPTFNPNVLQHFTAAETDAQGTRPPGPAHESQAAPGTSQPLPPSPFLNTQAQMLANFQQPTQPEVTFVHPQAVQFSTGTPVVSTGHILDPGQMVQMGMPQPVQPTVPGSSATPEMSHEHYQYLMAMHGARPPMPMWPTSQAPSHIPTHPSPLLFPTPVPTIDPTGTPSLNSSQTGNPFKTPGRHFGSPLPNFLPSRAAVSNITASPSSADQSSMYDAAGGKAASCPCPVSGGDTHGEVGMGGAVLKQAPPPSTQSKSRESMLMAMARGGAGPMMLPPASRNKNKMVVDLVKADSRLQPLDVGVAVLKVLDHLYRVEQTPEEELTVQCVLAVIKSSAGDARTVKKLKMRYETLFIFNSMGNVATMERTIRDMANEAATVKRLDLPPQQPVVDTPASHSAFSSLIPDLTASSWPSSLLLLYHVLQPHPSLSSPQPLTLAGPNCNMAAWLMVMGWLSNLGQPMRKFTILALHQAAQRSLSSFATLGSQLCRALAGLWRWPDDVADAATAAGQDAFLASPLPIIPSSTQALGDTASQLLPVLQQHMGDESSDAELAFLGWLLCLDICDAGCMEVAQNLLLLKVPESAPIWMVDMCNEISRCVARELLQFAKEWKDFANYQEEKDAGLKGVTIEQLDAETLVQLQALQALQGQEDDGAVKVASLQARVQVLTAVARALRALGLEGGAVMDELFPIAALAISPDVERQLLLKTGALKVMLEKSSHKGLLVVLSRFPREDSWKLPGSGLSSLVLHNTTANGDDGQEAGKDEKDFKSYDSDFMKSESSAKPAVDGEAAGGEAGGVQEPVDDSGVNEAQQQETTAAPAEPVGEAVGKSNQTAPARSLSLTREIPLLSLSDLQQSFQTSYLTCTLSDVITAMLSLLAASSQPAEAYAATMFRLLALSPTQLRLLYFLAQQALSPTGCIVTSNTELAPSQTLAALTRLVEVLCQEKRIVRQQLKTEESNNSWEGEGTETIASDEIMLPPPWSDIDEGERCSYFITMLGQVLDIGELNDIIMAFVERVSMMEDTAEFEVLYTYMLDVVRRSSRLEAHLVAMYMSRICGGAPAAGAEGK